MPPASGLPGSAAPGNVPPQPSPGVPLRVSTLELFFDLVFAFTLTQLTALLADHLSLTAVAQVLLIFGVLWWMYGGYAWLTNTATPDSTPQRLLLLAGMAGFLVVGLAIPHGFSHRGGANVSIDFKGNKLTVESAKGKETFEFSISEFDKALVEAGGWVDFADAKY